MSTSRAPEWATWCLSRSATAQRKDEAAKLRASAVDDRYPYYDPHAPAQAQPSAATAQHDEEEHAVASLTTLLRHRADQDIHESSWQECEGDTLLDDEDEWKEQDKVLGDAFAVQNVEEESDNDFDEIEDIRELLIRSTYGKYDGDMSHLYGPSKESASQSKTSGDGYDYSPLSPDESRALERCLRMSNFLPMPLPKEKDHRLDQEHRYLRASEAGTDTWHFHRRYEGDFSATRESPWRVGAHIDWQQKGIGTEHKRTKLILKNMMALFLPRRNVEWVSAQLTYGILEPLGIHHSFTLNGCEIHSIRESRRAIKDEKMKPDRAAIVLHSLALASQLDVREIEMMNSDFVLHASDPNVKRKVARRQHAESAAVVKALRMLFPNIFGDPTEQTPSVDWMMKEAHRNLLTAILDYSDQYPESPLTDLVRERSAQKQRHSEGVQTDEEQERMRGDGDLSCQFCGHRRTVSLNSSEEAQSVTATENPVSTIRTTSEVPQQMMQDESAAKGADEKEIDWANFEENSFAFKVVTKNKAIEDLTPYEQALLEHNGKIPGWLNTKMKRDLYHQARSEKLRFRAEKEKAQESKRKKADKDAKKLSEARKRIARERKYMRTIKKLRKQADALEHKRIRDEESFVKEREKDRKQKDKRAKLSSKHGGDLSKDVIGPVHSVDTDAHLASLDEASRLLYEAAEEQRRAEESKARKEARKKNKGNEGKKTTASRSNAADETVAIKRKRGRPRKTELVATVKRKRGRPRKSESGAGNATGPLGDVEAIMRFASNPAGPAELGDAAQAQMNPQIPPLASKEPHQRFVEFYHPHPITQPPIEDAVGDHVEPGTPSKRPPQSPSRSAASTPRAVLSPWRMSSMNENPMPM